MSPSHSTTVPSIRHPIRSRTSSAPAEPAGGAACVMSAPGSPTVIGRLDGPAGAVAMCVETESARIMALAARKNRAERRRERLVAHLNASFARVLLKGDSTFDKVRSALAPP